MAKSSIPPPGVAIASLDARKTQILNLMAPGPGTAWEDRGSIGVFGAFFKTAFKSMFKPAQLLDSIRRPETGGDSFSFALGCGLMWTLGAVVHGYLYFRHLVHEEDRTRGSTSENQLIVNGQLYVILCAIFAILMPVLVLLFQKIGSRIYFALVNTEMTNKAPPVLVYNIFGYCLGPSILAPIPYVGPPLAVIWILIALIAGGVTRMRISVKGAVIGSIISVLTIVAATTAVVFVAIQIDPAVTKEPPLARGRAR